MITAPSGESAAAWQPFTPQGIAAFASARLRRLLIVQFVAALFAAISVVWFLDAAWFPAVREGIRELPARGEIRAGELHWEADSPSVLAETHFLSFAVDLTHDARLRLPSHIQVEFGQTTVRLTGLFGYLELPYPATDWIVAFNRTELLPWWGAWEPPIFWIVAVAVVVGLGVIWAFLAAALSPAILFMAYFTNRSLSIRGAWKLSGAALMPGAFLMCAGILFYGSGWLDVVQFLVIVAAHLIAGVALAILSVFWAPKLPADASGRNPFRAADEDSGGKPRVPKNPFASR